MAALASQQLLISMREKHCNQLRPCMQRGWLGSANLDSKVKSLCSYLFLFQVLKVEEALAVE